jgi:hypothetical protein
VRKVILKTNLVTIGLVVVAIISTTGAIFGLVGQKNLNQVIEMQNAKIDDLIKTNKDLQFSKDVSSDSTITSIDELKKMIQDLTYRNSVLGTTSTNVGETAPPTSLGIVTLNSGVTSVNIYSGPKTQANILSSTVPSSLMFYSKKEAGWYQVQIGTDQWGWIQSKFVTDLNQ